MITTIFFDLDGTLLPMNQDYFIKGYFTELSIKMAQYGFEPKKLVEAVMYGTNAMIENNGQITNEDAFWRVFVKVYGDDSIKYKSILHEFYINEFQRVKTYCGFNNDAKKLVNALKQKNYKLVLATNPIFPYIATESRIKWAGLNVSDFEMYTSYENSHYCKPNIKYYQEILNRLNVSPKECIMIGNDVNEDMISEELGFETFLVTDCLINRDNINIDRYNNGRLIDAMKFILEKER